jgi:hypothetical protein
MKGEIIDELKLTMLTGERDTHPQMGEFDDSFEKLEDDELELKKIKK